MIEDYSRANRTAGMFNPVYSIEGHLVRLSFLFSVVHSCFTFSDIIMLIHTVLFLVIHIRIPEYSAIVNDLKLQCQWLR